MKTLEGKGMSISFKKRRVVNNISIHVSSGEVIGLLGPNGAGKTTTFHMILGIHRPDEGMVLLNGTDITSYPIYMRARAGIGFLPQEPSVFRGMSVLDNIYAVLEHRNPEGKANIEGVLEEMGLTSLRDRKASFLSGGERRRLEIARSLVLKPDFLLLDEPFAGIDPIQINEIRKLIGSFRNKGLGIVITDHNVREILKITDRSYIINKGELIFQGSSEELISNKRVKEEYLGKEFRWN